MKVYGISTLVILLIISAGCMEQDIPLVAVRDFSGITERNEWGDTLSVDSTDWIIDALVFPEAVAGIKSLPLYRNGIQLTGKVIQGEVDVVEYAIGAFPNPFVPGAGRLLIELTILDPLDVDVHVENPSGELSITLVDTTLSEGIYLFSWDGTYESGNTLSEGIYRIFFDAGYISSFGDVQAILSDQPDPPTNADYILFAYEIYDTLEYVYYEYQIASDFGWDGELGGDDTYALPLSSWMLLSYTQKFNYLPVFMNYNIYAANSYVYHYLLAYKHFQIGAGWPESGQYAEDPIDPSQPEWQYENYAHDAYLELYEGNP